MPENGAQYSSQTDSLFIDLKQPPGLTALGATNNGTLTRQRSFKLSTRSRLSSTLTEQYFTVNIPFDPEWEVDYDTLEFHSMLGEGAFGRVVKGVAHNLPGNPYPTTVAIKMLKGKFRHY